MKIFFINLLLVLLNVTEVSIDDPCAAVYVPNKVKNMNVQVLYLILWINETRLLVQYESLESKCRLNESVCISKKKQDHDEFQGETKYLDDWSEFLSMESQYL